MDMASLCTREVVGIAGTASLREAAALMCEQHVGALVVVTGDDPSKVVGVVTDRDLALEVLGRDAAKADLRIGDLVSGAPLAVPGTATVREAVASMEQAGVRRLLVVDADGGVIGLVSSDDLLAAIADDLESLARALRQGIEREKATRSVISKPATTRLVFPAFGTAAVQ